MLTPKAPVAVIARALVVSVPSETRIVGGSAETEAKAVTVIPQGLSPTQLVTSATPLGSALMASTKSELGADSPVGSVMSLSAGGMVSFSSAASGWQPPVRRPPTAAVVVRQSPHPPSRGRRL